MDTPFEAYVTNLGKYNEGRLVGESLKFPTTTEEVQALLKRIGIDGVRYEEIFITDYEVNISGLYDCLGEYESIDELNYLASLISEMDQSDREKFEAVIDSGEYSGSVKELINLTQNLDCFDEINSEYVVIAPSYMVYTADYSAFLKTHIDSGADITLMYHSVDNAKDHFPNCQTLNINKQKGVLSMEPNLGNAKNRNIFMDTYVMKKDLFFYLVQKAHTLSSMYTLADIVNESCKELDVRAYPHRGYFATISDFNSYYEANLELIDLKKATDLFHDNWPIYTRTNDSCPTQYFEGSKVTSSVISNGCLIEGAVENCVIGRGCTIKEGAVVKNCVIGADVVIGKDVHAENLVIDKHARLIRGKRIIASPDKPGYIKRGDRL